MTPVILSSPIVANATIGEHAVDYARLGWHVFPVPPGTKAGYSDLAKAITGRPWGASNDPEIVRAMFELHPEANIGVCTGDLSGFWALDLDTLAGGHAAAAGSSISFAR